MIKAESLSKQYPVNKKHYTRQNKTRPFIADPVEAHRLAQRQEYLRRKKEELKEEEEINSRSEAIQRKGLQKHKRPNHFKRYHNNAPSKSRETTLEEKITLTYQWLSKTFPFLFGADAEVRPLDVHIIRNIKQHYKKYQITKGYPRDVAIKAALYRYMESSEYRACLKEGVPRYDFYGNIKGIVTKEEGNNIVE